MCVSLSAFVSLSFSLTINTFFVPVCVSPFCIRDCLSLRRQHVNAIRGGKGRGQCVRIVREGCVTLSGGVWGVDNLDVNRTGKACFDFRSIHHLKKGKRGKEAENQSLLVTMQGMLRNVDFFCSFDAGVPGRIVPV
jgi:hypothetical protein